jgi:dephospho-CoA kinase
MYCVGLTGSIASGKSTVAALFEQLGVDLIDADHIAKQLTSKDQPALTEIITHFGPEFLDTEGHLHRRLLRDCIFKYPQERVWLEQLLHPLIRQAIATRLKVPVKWYYMLEIPLLFNKKDYPYLDRVLVVLSEPATQIQRVMQRDQHNESQAKTILKTQASAEAYRNLADDILINNSSILELEEAVLSFHQQYLSFSQGV